MSYFEPVGDSAGFVMKDSQCVNSQTGAAVSALRCSGERAGAAYVMRDGQCVNSATGTAVSATRCSGVAGGAAPVGGGFPFLLVGGVAAAGLVAYLIFKKKKAAP